MGELIRLAPKTNRINIAANEIKMASMMAETSLSRCCTPETCYRALFMLG